MRIVVEENPALKETEIVIRCKETTPQVMGMLAALRSFDQRLTGDREGQTYLLDASQVLYIESVDKRSFLYTEEGVYETSLRLYELEERLNSWASAVHSSRFGRPSAADHGKWRSGGCFPPIRPDHPKEAGHLMRKREMNDEKSSANPAAVTDQSVRFVYGGGSGVYGL